MLPPPSALNAITPSKLQQKENADVIKDIMLTIPNAVFARKDVWNVLGLNSAQTAMIPTLWMEVCAKKMDWTLSLSF